MLNKLTPSGRLWVVTVIVFVLAIALFPRDSRSVVPFKQKEMSGQVVAYYTNDYQRYAIDQLTKDGRLEQWSCLHDLWTRESNWRPNALNKTSKAAGIAQFMPVTWGLVGYKQTEDGYLQVDAGLAYIERKYGGNICKAYASNLSRGWY